MPFRYQAVLFDAAETLFTTRGSVGEIYADVARTYGSQALPRDIQAAFSRHFRGAGPISVSDQKRWWKDIVRNVFLEVGMVNDFDSFFDRVYDRFRDSQGWILFPETREVLTSLKDHGIKIGLISNFDTRVYSVLDSLHIGSFFDAVTLSSETGYSKPAPEIFSAAVSALGVTPDRVLLVGDSLRDDIEGGIRAGLEAILIDRAGRYSSLADVRRIESLSEIMPLLA